MLRVIAAVALMIGFYVLALGVAFGLLAGVWISFATGHVYLRLVFFAIATAGVILWSILPRFDKFTAPGPRLTPESQPALFALVRGVAAATSEAMPSEVYLVADVNAYVAHRGGLAGLGSRRIMGVGLPLLQILTASQLRAVLAHEFGHYAAGDLKLGAFIYRTRAAMARTIENLSRTSSWTHKLFLVYGNLFMRVTQAIARRQEIAADRIAVRVAGAQSHAEALRAVHGAAAAYGAYWRGEVLPVVSNGYQPPIVAGFAQFVRADVVAKAIASAVEEEMKTGAADPYDSHPSLKERLAAIVDCGGHAAAPTAPAWPAHSTAIALIRDLPRLELEMFGGTLKPVEWHDTPMQVFLPHWRERAAELARVCADATAADVPRLVQSLRGDVTERQAALASIVAAKLVDDGWSCTTSPGEQIVFTKNGRSFLPFVEAAREPAAWTAAVTDAGIAALPLH